MSDHKMIIYYNDKIAGYIRVVTKDACPDFPFIEYLVIEEYRQKGLINKYLPLFLDELKKQGIKAVLAEVLKENKVSQHILKKHGFIDAKIKNKTANAFIKILIGKA